MIISAFFLSFSSFCSFQVGGGVDVTSNVKNDTNIVQCSHDHHNDDDNDGCNDSNDGNSCVNIYLLYSYSPH